MDPLRYFGPEIVDICHGGLKNKVLMEIEPRKNGGLLELTVN